MTLFVFEYVTAYAASGVHPPLAASLLAEGRAMRDAVAGDLQALRNRGVEVVLAESLRDFPRLAAMADDTIVIAPEFSNILFNFATEVLELGGRLLGPSPETIELTSDKLRLFDHWQRHQVATPQTWVLGHEPERGEMVLKPRNGAGSQATRLKSIPPSESWIGEMLATEYVRGIAASQAFLIRNNEVTPLLPCEQLLSDDGRFQYRGGRITHPWEFSERVEAIARQAIACVSGLSGFVGVDVVIGDDGRDWAIEINPRFTTSYIGLRRMTRSNLMGKLLGDSDPIDWDRTTLTFSPDSITSA